MWQRGLHYRTGEGSVKAPARLLTRLQTKVLNHLERFLSCFSFSFLVKICWYATDLLIQVLRFNLGNGMRVSLSTVGEGVSRQTLQGERDYPLCSSISISQDTLGELWYTFGPSSLIPFS